ncbi:MAG: DUF4336 domain-containing protein [Methylovirgula sp.]
MTRDAFFPYAPIDTLKPFAEELWIVDGPEIGMHYLGMTLPFPTRMTVVRLPSEDLWIHSPIHWNDALGGAIDELGPVCHLVAPNTLHYWYLPDWQARYPKARTYGAPDLTKRARRPITIDETLSEVAPLAWMEQFAQCLVPGSLLTEVDFFHFPSRTLILTDLIENFEPNRVRNPLLRWVMKVFGAADPDGKAPLDMQWSFRPYRRDVRAAVERMIEWMPEKIVIAHGRCYESEGVRELQRAFRWVL